MSILSCFLLHARITVLTSYSNGVEREVSRLRELTCGRSLLLEFNILQDVSTVSLESVRVRRTCLKSEDGTACLNSNGAAESRVGCDQLRLRGHVVQGVCLAHDAPCGRKQDEAEQGVREGCFSKALNSVLMMCWVEVVAIKSRSGPRAGSGSCVGGQAFSRIAVAVGEQASGAGHEYEAYAEGSRNYLPYVRLLAGVHIRDIISVRCVCVRHEVCESCEPSGRWSNPQGSLIRE